MSADIHPCCLTIAGSYSGGNAGVQADLRAFHAYGLHGCTVFAALTAQNPFGVSAIHAVPPDFIAAQLDAVLGVYAIRALKTGMLADAAAIEVVTDRIARHPEIAATLGIPPKSFQFPPETRKRSRRFGGISQRWGQIDRRGVLWYHTI